MVLDQILIRMVGPVLVVDGILINGKIKKSIVVD